MILTRYLNDDINGEIECIQYFGEDLDKFQARESIKKSILSNIYKDCEMDDGCKGFIIGIEDNYAYNDYYYIIWIPQTEQICYELVNGMSRYISKK